MTETVSTAVAHSESKAELAVKSYTDRFDMVLPEQVDVQAFVGLALGALYRDPALMTAANNSPGAFMNTLMRCASLGHQPGSEEFYLVPRKNGRTGKKEIAGIEGYRGIIERMYRSGAVASVVVREVCERDEFAFVEGVHDVPVHKIDWFGSNGRGKMIGVYAYAKLTTGATSRVVVLNEADVMASRDKSDAKDSDFSPWNRLDAGAAHPEFKGRSMWWKTAARRLEPWVPTSAEYRRELLRSQSAAATVTPPAERPTFTPDDDEQRPAYVDDDGVVDAELVDANEQTGAQA